MPTWSNNQIKNADRITQNTLSFNNTKYSKTTQIISSRKDDDTGQTIRTIWTENNSNQKTKPAYSITTGLLRFNMVGITIFVLSTYGAINQFTINDLKITSPNYGVRNEFIPLDPNNVNYVQYGNGVVDNVVNFITAFGSTGTQAKAFWDSFTTFLGLQTDAINYSTETRSFTTIFTQARWDTLKTYYQTDGFTNPNWRHQLFNVLTTTERNYFNTTNPKYWGGYFTSNYNKPTDWETQPYNVIRSRAVYLFITPSYNSTFYLALEYPSVLNFIRGEI